jgi:tRNA G18 (ribose-2'-O)-methylase SpoU
MKKKLIIIAHNIRSAHNVGAFFRTADGAGVIKIYLTGYTGSPFNEKKDKFETKAQRALGKTALGAIRFVKWEKREDIFSLIKNLKKDGFQILALENIHRSKDIFKFRSSSPCALILGNENKGIDKSILKECDKILAIPMRGKKESLNVSVAAGIAMYLLSK